jgi:hypothetical protein
MTEMNSKWPVAGRYVWLSGGLVARNAPNDATVELCIGARGPITRQFGISNYGFLFEALRRMRLKIIGVSFVQHIEQAEGLRPAEFRAAGPANGWLLAETRQKWRQITIAAGREQRFLQLMDVSSRIASGLLYSELRLLDLASAYSSQLGALARKKETEKLKVFKDLFSFQTYKCIHALFWELAVLRDTLAEFAAIFCFGAKEIRTLKGLRKWLNRNSALSDALASHLLEITDSSKGGWLSEFTSYRNFFTHVAPLEMAAGFAFTIQDVRALEEGLSVPQIYYPLPEKIEELTSRWSNGFPFSSFEEIHAVSKANRDRSKNADALEYLHEALNKFVKLANELLSRSPVKAEMINLGPEDFIGGVHVTPADIGIG